MKKFVVGIPTHAEGAVLEDCVESVIREIRTTNIEVDDTKILLSLSGVSRFSPLTSDTFTVAHKLKLKYDSLIDIISSDKGKVNAVNDIFKKAKDFTNYLVMADSDIFLDKGSFKEILNPLFSDEYVLVRGKSSFYGGSDLSKYYKHELKRRNILSTGNGMSNHRLVSGPLYGLNLDAISYAFNKFGFIGEGSPRIPNSIICEDQFIAEIVGGTFDDNKMKKSNKAIYNHREFNIEDGSLMSYWIRGIQGGIQLDRMGFRNAVYRGPTMTEFVPDNSIEIYDFDNNIVDKLDIEMSSNSIQKIVPKFISLEDKLRFQQNLQYTARELLDKSLSPEYWKPLNKNLSCEKNG